MFGVSPEILKDCAQQLRDEERGFDREGFCRALGAPPSEALWVLDQMIDAGFIELSGSVGLFMPTVSLNQLALAPVSWGLPREEADLLLARIVQKATKINEASGDLPVLGRVHRCLRLISWGQAPPWGPRYRGSADQGSETAPAC